METFICTQCQQTKEIPQSGGTGYGIDKDENKVCYQCIGENDLKAFESANIGEKFTMYLSIKGGKAEITNWPGSFKKEANHMRTGRHNMAGKRYDTYFKIAGKQFWGVTYGDQTQIHHVKCVKP